MRYTVGKMALSDFFRKKGRFEKVESLQDLACPCEKTSQNNQWFLTS